MAVIEYDEYKQKLQALEPTLGELEKALGIPKAREELAELQKETEQEGFWNDLERSQQVSRQVKRLENKIKKHDKLVSEWEDTLTLCEMAQEEDDPSQLEEVVSGYETLEKEISERHRHRYEFNNDFRCELQQDGLTLAGTSPDGALVEIVEIKDHPWYVGCQFHPEFKSRPNRPHPLLYGFVKAALEAEEKR